MDASSQDVQVLVVDDNPIIRDLITRGMEAHCAVTGSSDGADALLKSVDAPPDLIISDFRMPGLDGRQLYEKLRSRDRTRNIPFIFIASRGDIEEKLRPSVGGGVEDFIAKPFFVADLVRQVKKIVDRLHLEKMQRRASRPGIIQGRLEEMSVTELMQSLEMGQKTCRLTLKHADQKSELYFNAGQCRHAQSGSTEGDTVVYQAIGWLDGEFEIEFNATSDRETTTLSTTGLLMEAMRLMDETNESVQS
ncbi:MAG TPA: response regulator [Candidatus Acidoferrales bacterium]|jgi:CheY-like chemotaxis protein|nr:response regulator [Candidatus Acidoferrales bacterium]